jgi:hypothetical protein
MVWLEHSLERLRLLPAILLVSEWSTKDGQEGMQEFGGARIHPGNLDWLASGPGELSVIRERSQSREARKHRMLPSKLL